MILLIAQDVAQGASRAAAAASVRATEDQLNQWLQRGRRDAMEKKDTVYAHLLMECLRAARHHELHLLELGDRAAQDKTLNVRWVTWKLAFLRPNEFSARALEGSAAANGFALMSPEEAVTSVHQMLEDFLSRHEKDAAPEAPEGAASVG